MRRLLFISNLFPDTREAYRGLDNAAILHRLADRWEIASFAMRPVLPFAKKVWQHRPADSALHPRFVATRYVPKIGHRVNHKLMAAALRPRLREFRGAFDVALSAWIYPDSCAVAMLSKELGFPFVSIAQGSDVHQYLGIKARRKIIARLMPAAAGIITRSAELARLLADAGLPKERLHPIHNGIDLEHFAPADRTVARMELGLPEEPRIVLFVGNFYAIKNPLVLVEAFAQLAREDEFRDLLLVLVGGGPLEGELQYRAQRPGLAGRIVIAGRHDSAHVAKFMQASDVLCLPSSNEGVPNVILEAFACGLPVVASKVGGIPEVHTGGHLGLLAPPRDIEALAGALRGVLSKLPDRAAIRAHAETFTWERAADAYHEVLSRACGPGGAAR